MKRFGMLILALQLACGLHFALAQKEVNPDAAQHIEEDVELEDLNIAAKELAIISTEVRVMQKGEKLLSLQEVTRSGPYYDSEYASSLYYALKTETDTWQKNPDVFNKSEGEVSEVASLNITVKILQTGRYTIEITKAGKKNTLKDSEISLEKVINDWAFFYEVEKHKSIWKKLLPF